MAAAAGAEDTQNCVIPIALAHPEQLTAKQKASLPPVGVYTVVEFYTTDGCDGRRMFEVLKSFKAVFKAALVLRRSVDVVTGTELRGLTYMDFKQRFYGVNTVLIDHEAYQSFRLQPFSTVRVYVSIPVSNYAINHQDWLERVKVTHEWTFGEGARTPTDIPVTKTAAVGVVETIMSMTPPEEEEDEEQDEEED